MQATKLTEKMTVKNIEALAGALKQARQEMPDLMKLTRQERALLRQPRHEQIKALEVSLAVARENPGLVPSQISLVQFERQVDQVTRLDACYEALQQLTSDVRDTLRVVASDPLQIGAEIRSHVLAASKRTPALEPLVRKLGGKKTRTVRGTPNASGAAEIATATAGGAGPAPAPPAPVAPSSVPVPNSNGNTGIPPGKAA